MNINSLISVEANYEHTENRWHELEDLARQFIQEDPSMEEVHDFDLSIRLAVGREAEQIISATIEEQRAKYGFLAKSEELADDWFIAIDDEKRRVEIVYLNLNILSDSNYSLHEQALLLWSGLLIELNPEGCSTRLCHPTQSSQDPKWLRRATVADREFDARTLSQLQKLESIKLSQLEQELNRWLRKHRWLVGMRDHKMLWTVVPGPDTEF